MLAETPTRRELLLWMAVAIAVVVAITAVRTDDAGAGLGDASSTNVVFIASGLNFPDALGAGSPAALGLGPILLVQQNAIPQATLDELNRLQPQEVVIVGGTAAVSQSVEDTLNALGFNPSVTRVSGSNRYETAAELSQAIFPTTGKYGRIGFATTSNAADPQGAGAIDINTVQFLAPDHGFLYATATVDSEYGSFAATFTCKLWLDDAATGTLTGSVMGADVDSANTEENCATQGIVEVDPGVHTIGFSINSSAPILNGDASLIVMWIPFSADGTTPQP